MICSVNKLDELQILLIAQKIRKNVDNRTYMVYYTAFISNVNNQDQKTNHHHTLP